MNTLGNELLEYYLPKVLKLLFRTQSDNSYNVIIITY